MVKSVGKQFEKDFASSLPTYCYVHRLRDSAQSYNNSKQTSFAWNNECDFYIWNSKHRTFYAVECKSTKHKSMSAQLSKDDKSSKMIKLHQIESLTKISAYDGAVACFFLNFRDEKNDSERLYFINITDFNNMMRETGKASFNEIDILLHNGVKISGEKKRVRYKWNLNEFFESYNN